MFGDTNGIERLKKKLYARSGEGLGVKKRRKLRELSFDVKTQWKPDPIKKNKVNKNRLLFWLLIFSSLFFVGAIAISVFFFFADRNIVSPSNVEIEIQGPSTVGGGKELVLQILVTNKNAIQIKDVDLLLEYPSSTRTAGDLTRELLRSREKIGLLQPGERIQRTARAVLFGEEGESRVVKVTVEYRVEGSNAIFHSDQTYEINLSNAPLSLLVDSVDTISSGQELGFTVTVVSNSDTIIKDVLLSAEYPFGFDFLRSDPSPFAKKSVWKLGDIKPEQKKVIQVYGNILGEAAEERVFRFSAGLANENDDTKLETAFVTFLKPIVVERPFIGVDMAINGDKSQTSVIDRSSRVRADVAWVNNLSDKIYDAEIEVKIVGNILDEKTVVSQRGFYRSSDDTVVWSRETLPSLATLSAGDRGTVSFSFIPIQTSSADIFRTPYLVLDVTIRGKRISQNNVPEIVESTVRRTLQVVTDLSPSSRAAYTNTPFSNIGPIPPKAETKTTYTIFWEVNNSTNPVGNVTMSASLPSYMSWVGAVSPESEQVEFNEVGGRIRWDIGSIPAHKSRKVAFQVAIYPSVSQVGTIPIIISGQRVDGMDTFTTTKLNKILTDLSTRLLGDPSFPPEGGKVVE